jgi:hypothetical protein
MTVQSSAPYTARPDTAFAISRSTVWLWLTLLILVSIYMRVHVAYHYAYGNDESFHIGIASAESLKNVLRYSLYEAHPPLLYILLHYWLKISSAPEFSRILPLLFGIALIPIYYLIGTKINGRLCGLCCAALIAFSYGCIMQSFVMRQYSIMLPFISLHFYCYLCWRELHTRLSLAGCVIFGWLAALSEFSAFFYFACIATFEMLSLLKCHAGRQWIAEWIISNLSVAAVCAYLYHLWEPTEQFYRMHDGGFFLRYASTASGVLTDTVTGLINAVTYMGPAFPFPILFMIAIGYICGFWPVFRKGECYFASYIMLAGLACCVSMAIYVTRIYPPIDVPRRSIWMLPLLVPVTGVMLAELLKKVDVPSKPMCACIIAAAMASAAFFDSVKQHTSEEYRFWQSSIWHSVTDTLELFGPNDVIITDSAGSNLLISLYPYRSNAAFLNGHVALLVPYHHTNLLIAPEYFGNFSPQSLRQMLLETQKNHLLDTIQRLVFLKVWEKYPFYDLVTCKGLSKETFLYGDLSGIQIHPDALLPSYGFAVIAIAKQTLFQDVLSAQGKERSCIDEKNDTIKNYYVLMSAKHFAP